MKLYTLCALAALIGCGASTSNAWDAAANGNCYDVYISRPASVKATCPNRGHFEPLESGRTPDDKFVGYICSCQR